MQQPQPLPSPLPDLCCLGKCSTKGAEQGSESVLVKYPLFAVRSHYRIIGSYRFLFSKLILALPNGVLLHGLVTSSWLLGSLLSVKVVARQTSVWPTQVISMTSTRGQELTWPQRLIAAVPIGDGLLHTMDEMAQHGR